MNPAFSILVRCDASSTLGFGHVVRALALARELTERGGATVTFAMREGPAAMALVESDGFAVLNDRARQGDGAAWLRECVRQTRADALVLDVRDQLPVQAVAELRAGGLLIATVDDPSDRRLVADLAFYPPVPQIAEFDWSGFSGTRLVGGEWVVLRREFAQQPVRRARTRPTLLVTMGGSDPAGMTEAAVEGLGALGAATFDLVVVLGPGFLRRGAVDGRLDRAALKATVLERPADMRAVMLEADLAVASFGVTAYELAATATPAVYFCLTGDHARSASLFDSRGAGVSLGTFQRRPGEGFAGAVGSLVGDPARRERMGRAGRALVDGSGASRVADRIVETLRQRRRS